VTVASPQEKQKRLTKEELMQLYNMPPSAQFKLGVDGKRVKWADIDDDERCKAPGLIQEDGTNNRLSNEPLRRHAEISGQKDNDSIRREIPGEVLVLATTPDEVQGREEAVKAREKAVEAREKALPLREEALQLREKALQLREKALLIREEAEQKERTRISQEKVGPIVGPIVDKVDRKVMAEESVTLSAAHEDHQERQSEPDFCPFPKVVQNQQNIITVQNLLTKVKGRCDFGAWQRGGSKGERRTKRSN
jgi:hypothetical protein